MPVQGVREATPDCRDVHGDSESLAQQNWPGVEGLRRLQQGLCDIAKFCGQRPYPGDCLRVHVAAPTATPGHSGLPGRPFNQPLREILLRLARAIVEHCLFLFGHSF